MLIAQDVKDRLKKNWGEKAETLNCYAEVKLIDPLSSWACYIFAMDKDGDMVNCLLYSDAMGVEIYTQCICDIYSMYNEEGENPMVDTEFRRMRVIELLR